MDIDIYKKVEGIIEDNKRACSFHKVVHDTGIVCE